MKVKEESERVSLKVNIQKTNMASGTITSWQIDGETGETVETVTDFMWGPHNHCRWWLQSWNLKTLAPWKNSYDQPRQHIKKQREITLPTKVNLVKAMVFPVIYGCESWTIKKAECWKTDAFELRCWRRLLRVPWTARKSNQSILKEINPWIFMGTTDAKAETPILWPLDVKNWLIGKDPWYQEGLGAGGEEDDRGWDGWMVSPTQCTWVWASSRSWRWTGKPGMLQSTGLQIIGQDWGTELNWRVRL